MAKNDPMNWRKWRNFQLSKHVEKKDILNEDSYHASEIENFIKKNEKAMGEYYPTIKVFGSEGDTKHLNVSFDILRQIAKIMKKMKL